MFIKPKNKHQSKTIDVKKIRKDFPILNTKVYGKQLVYFDNAATTHKPQSVINAINKVHAMHNSNVHRGVHYLSGQMTEMYEAARFKIQKYINAKAPYEIIFTCGVTASINLVAYSFGEAFIKEGDEIIVSELEHHSNIVPWQIVCERKKVVLKVIPFEDSGDLIMSEYEKLITEKTKLVAVTHASNSLGTITPIKDIIAIAHRHNIPVLIDGAQAIQHIPVDVQDLDCDFYAFSGHKIFGPTGTGVLYSKESWLEKMPPYQGGGDMIDRVTFAKTTYNDLPFKFEAGTPNYIGAVGLGAAIDYVNSVGLEKINRYEHELLEYGTEKLKSIDGIRIYGEAKQKVGVLSFALRDIHAYDLGMCLDKMSIAVRTGHHCTQPLWDHYKAEGAARASLAFYNTFDEIDALYDALKEVDKIFK